MKITQVIDEGINDPSIYKVIFVAGGPGSGKSRVVKNSAFTALGFKIVNNDVAFERYMNAVGLATTPDNIYSQKGQEIRLRAKELTNKQMQIYLQGYLGLVIDGTGKDFAKIQSQAEKLKNMGYDTVMVFVNTDIETALMRNRARRRQIPDDELKKMWGAVQRNLGKFQNYFGNQMFIVDNNSGDDIEMETTRLFKKIKSWASSPPRKNT